MTTAASAPLPPSPFTPLTVTAIFIGGALGTLARFLLDTAHPVSPGHFPLTTLIINLSGSLAIGLLIPLLEPVNQRAPWARPLLVIGVLGGWTTYSTLAVDSVQLWHHGHVGLMVGYLAATVIGGIAAVVVAHTLVHRLVRP
jgi:CrcB protein